MTIAEAKQQGYTHHARMYGFTGYACPDNDEHDTFRAKFWLTDRIVEACIYIEMFIPNENGFKILLGSKL